MHKVIHIVDRQSGTNTASGSCSANVADGCVGVDDSGDGINVPHSLLYIFSQGPGAIILESVGGEVGVWTGSSPVLHMRVCSEDEAW